MIDSKDIRTSDEILQKILSQIGIPAINFILTQIFIHIKI